MIRTGLKMIGLIGVGALVTQLNWQSGVSDTISWFQEPTVGEFEAHYVTEFGNSYTQHQFDEIKDDCGSKFICPVTGAVEYEHIVGRKIKDFWGTFIRFEPAEEVQNEIRVKSAKGDMDWKQFFDTARKVRLQDEDALRRVKAEAKELLEQAKQIRNTTGEDDPGEKSL